MPKPAAVSIRRRRLFMIAGRIVQAQPLCCNADDEGDARDAEVDEVYRGLLNSVAGLQLLFFLQV